MGLSKFETSDLGETQMELIERYLQAVKFALPKAHRDDIIKELRDSILSQIEEKETELGHPLSQDEQADLLKKLGKPSRLASGYRKRQSLIGATIFPIYWKILKASLGLAFLVLVAASIATAAVGKGFMESLGVLFRYPGVALMTFAWITLFFSALEFFGAKVRARDTWDPGKLPPLVKHEAGKSRFELITQLLMQTIFGIWWLAGLHSQYLLFGPGAAFFRLGPVWNAIYPLFVVIVLADVGLTAAMLVWPLWPQARSWARVIMSALGLLVCYFLVKSPDLFVAADPSLAQLQTLAKNINYGVHLSLTVLAIVSAIIIVREGVRLAGQRFSHVHHVTVGS
jgi:hypothetical protein